MVGEGIAISRIARGGLNTLIILGTWTVWNHKNKCVFEGANPNIGGSLILLGEECHLWMLAGARGLSHVMAPLQMWCVVAVLFSLKKA
jgi:hypothetical protein